ncbi:MAG: hypothetical protein ACJAT6_000244 [Akkermansiaceae bacterium]|jgi:hypothetical protein
MGGEKILGFGSEVKGELGWFGNLRRLDLLKG